MAEEEKGDAEESKKKDESPMGDAPDIEVEEGSGGASLSEKYGEFSEKVSQNEHVQKGKAFVLSHKRETIMAVLLLIALLFAWKWATLGGALLGILSGLSLSKQWFRVWSHAKGHLEVQGGHFKIYAGLVTALGALVCAPGLTIGSAIGVALKVAWDPKSHSMNGDD
jgi:hypothetical protein